MATKREAAAVVLIEAVGRNRDLLEPVLPSNRAVQFHYGMREIADAWDRYKAAADSEVFQSQVRDMPKPR